MWDLHLAYSDAAFLERHAGDFQLLLTERGSARAVFNETRAQDDEESAVALTDADRRRVLFGTRRSITRPA